MVGGRKFVTFTSSELQTLFSQCEVQMEVADIAAISCRSVLLHMQRKENSVLYRVGEYILVKSETNDNEQVIQAIDFFAIHHDDCYKIFVKGKLFVLAEDNLTHLYSGSVIVVPTSDIIFAPAISILRKLILYLADESNTPYKYVVIDYLRPNMGISAEDVIVPIYPEVGDMLKVCGSNNEVWYAHVRTVDNHAKTCQVHFYVEDSTCPTKYRRETLCRRTIEVVHWDSIVDIASGYWNASGNYWYSDT